MACTWEKVPFGLTARKVSPLGLASSYRIGTSDVERAYERGINYFYWGSARRPEFGQALRNLGRTHRSEMLVVVQSYARLGSMIPWSLERALRKLQTDYADVLLLGWWNHLPPGRILDAARKLRDQGKTRHIMVSCHNRLSFERYIDDPTFDAIMVRYNAAHTGAEKEVFPFVDKRRVGVVSYTATRWGSLLDKRNTPVGDKTPQASDCYRFALTNPHVDVVLTGPKNGAELDEAMSALDRGPMTEEELAWMKRVGQAIRAKKNLQSRFLD